MKLDTFALSSLAVIALASTPACSEKKGNTTDTSSADTAPTDTVVTDSGPDGEDGELTDSVAGDGETSVCTAGTSGCECRVGGGCDDGLVCGAGNLCGAAGNCDGRLGCACAAGACDPGLVCASDTCGVANGVLLKLAGGDARSCDLAVTTTGRHVAAVVYPDGVRGHMWTRDARTTIALMRSADEALGGVVAAVVFEGDTAASSALVSVIKATCYDRHGAPDAAATVTAQ